MKKLIVALLGTTAIYTAAPAQADTWSGFYGGVFLGYGWSNTDVGYLDDAGTLLGLGDPCQDYQSASVSGTFFGVQVSDEYPDGPPPPSYYCEYPTDTSVKSQSLPGQTNLGSFDADGEMIGVTAGINYQTGNWVFGIEAEGGLLGLNETYRNVGRVLGTTGEASAAFTPVGGTEITVDAGMYIGAFGRIGYSFGDTLLYGKAGYGAADLGITVNVIDPICGASDICWSSTTNDMTEAFMYGAGIEHVIGKGLSLKLEYLRMEFAPEELIVQNFGAWDYYEFDTSVDTVKLGLNYRLGTPD